MAGSCKNKYIPAHNGAKVDSDRPKDNLVASVHPTHSNPVGKAKQEFGQTDGAESEPNHVVRIQVDQ